MFKSISSWPYRPSWVSRSLLVFLFLGPLERPALLSRLYLNDGKIKLTRQLGHQIALTTQHFDDLSVNEAETYGFHFP